jgi:hypothetical protein
MDTAFFGRGSTNTNFIVFGCDQRFKPMIYPTRGEYVNHYTTDTVSFFDFLSTNGKKLQICRYM